MQNKNNPDSFVCRCNIVIPALHSSVDNRVIVGRRDDGERIDNRNNLVRLDVDSYCFDSWAYISNWLGCILKKRKRIDE